MATPRWKLQHLFVAITFVGVYFALVSYNELRWEVAVPLFAAPVLLFVMIYDLSIPRTVSYTISIVCICILICLVLCVTYLYVAQFSRNPYNFFE